MADPPATSNARGRRRFITAATEAVTTSVPRLVSVPGVRDSIEAVRGLTEAFKAPKRNDTNTQSQIDRIDRLLACAQSSDAVGLVREDLDTYRLFDHVADAGSTSVRTFINDLKNTKELLARMAAESYTTKLFYQTDTERVLLEKDRETLEHIIEFLISGAARTNLVTERASILAQRFEGFTSSLVASLEGRNNEIAELKHRIQQLESYILASNVHRCADDEYQSIQYHSDSTSKRSAEESRASSEALLKTQKFLDLQLRKQSTQDRLAELDRSQKRHQVFSISGYKLRPGEIYHTTDHSSLNQEENSYLTSSTGKDIMDALPKARASRMLVTDFCGSDNFFKLRYMLDVSNGTARWVETLEWAARNKGLDSEGYDWVDVGDYPEDMELAEVTEDVEAEWVDISGWMEVAPKAHTIHFSACTSSEAAWGTDSEGYFTLAIKESWTEGGSLPSRLTNLRECVRARLHAGGNSHLRQTPQIYTDTKLDLDTEFTWEAFALGPGSKGSFLDL